MNSNYQNGKIYIIANDQSGHYQTKQETLLNLLKSLLESKGYGPFEILIPPRDKPQYRTYITNDPNIARETSSIVDFGGLRPNQTSGTFYLA